MEDVTTNLEDEYYPEVYKKELEKLEGLGLSLAEAVGPPVAPSGSGAHCLVDNGLLQRGLNEIHSVLPDFCTDDSAVGSATPSNSDNNILSRPSRRAFSATDSCPGRPPLHPNPSEPSESRRHSVDNSALQKPSESPALEGFRKKMETTERKKYFKRRNKVDEYFDIVPRELGRRRSPQLRCTQCGTRVAASKRRNRVFHLIICSSLSIEKRLLFYLMTNDEEKPPLLPNPLPGMTVAEAKRVEKEEQRRKSLRSLVKSPEPGSVTNNTDLLLAIEKLDLTTPIGECPSDQQDFATKLVVSYFVEDNIPFSHCDLRDGAPRGLVNILKYLRPGFKMPSSAKLGEELLYQYHSEMAEELRRKLRELLQDGRATLMFDGSEDVTGAPMVNFLVRVMGSAHMNTQTFFLTTVYTGSDTVDANYYMRMSEEVVNQFIGFEKTAGVVTDNTGSVRNARDMLKGRYPRVVVSQDQAHVADILMSDIGEIAWVKEILKKLMSLSSDLRRFRKLNARLNVLMNDYNAKKGVPAVGESNGDREIQMKEGTEVGKSFANKPSEGSVHEDSNTHERFLTIGQQVRGFLEGRDNDLEASHDASHVSTKTSSTTCPSQTEIANSYQSYPKKKARTLKKVSSVRFASHEKLLDEYKSLRPVLLQLVDDPLFVSLYRAKNQEERTKRQATFVEPIRDDELFNRVRQTHDIFRGCRAYLRVFDSETAMASEVFEATELLQETLSRLPPGHYPEPRATSRQELLDILENRMIGPLPGRKQIQVRLLSDLHITAALLDPYRTPLSPEDYMPSFRRHLDKYLQGTDWEKLGIAEEDRCQFIEDILSKYNNVRGIWRKRGFLTERTYASLGSGSGDEPIQPVGLTGPCEISNDGSASVKPSARRRRLKNPIAWWTSGSVEKPRDPFERKAVEELIEFARCTLSVSPTATGTERTFSYESRIHPVNRSSLSKEKVRKILFCQWNGRVLGRYSSRDEEGVNLQIEKHIKGMKKLRQLRSAATAAADAEAASQTTAVRQQLPVALQEDRIDDSRRLPRTAFQSPARAAQEIVPVPYSLAQQSALQSPARVAQERVPFAYPVAQQTHPDMNRVAQEGLLTSMPLIIPQPQGNFQLQSENPMGYTS